MISIVIPIYKSQKTLKRCLDSFSGLRDSQLQSIEFILVLDGDNSECEFIIEEWQKEVVSRSRIVRQKHFGVASARNLGASKSTYDFITFLDADDGILSARFDVTHDLRENMIIIGRQEVIIENSNSNEMNSIAVPSPFHILTMILHRKTFTDIGGFDESISHGSDWDFMIRAREHNVAINYSDLAFVKRYIHEDNHSFDSKKVQIQHLEAVRRHLNRRASN